MAMQANTEDPRIVAGMAAQGRLRESRLAAGERRVGWKAGLGTAQAMENVSITAPLTGFLTNASLASGMTRTDGLSIDDWRNAMLEPEVAVRIGTDLAAGADRRTVEAAISGAAPAIEIVDLGDPSDIEQVLAENLFHRAYLFDEFTDVSGSDLAATRLDVTQDGGEPQTDDRPGDGARRLGRGGSCGGRSSRAVGRRAARRRRRHDRLGAAADRDLRR